MTKENLSLSPSEAAKQLGVSVKALRLYEQRSLIMPARTEAGWRCYRPEDMRIAVQVIALRGLGLSLAQIKRVLDGDLSSFESALAVREQELDREIGELRDRLARVRALRSDANGDGVTPLRDLSDLMAPKSRVVASFALPWPWDGEMFSVQQPQRLNFIVGPLASGKTRFSECLARALPDCRFLGPDRSTDFDSRAGSHKQSSADLSALIDDTINWFVDEGADVNEALIALVTAIEAAPATTLVVDYIEQGLSTATQHALGAYIRRPRAVPRTLFVMTRSTAILDPDEVGPDESIILCPPNQSQPMYVAPFDGAPGYETVRLCLAAPEVRQRMAGVVAIHRSDCA